MAKVMITESYLEDIADAIREKKGGSDTYTPGEMAEAISSIDGGGIDIPVFTLTWNSDWTEIVSITCTKTYSECVSLYNDYAMGGAYVESYIQGSQMLEESYVANVIYSTDMLKYEVGYPPFADITYLPNGNIWGSIPSNEERSSTDLIVSGATVSVPSGYYSVAASKSVASMTLPTSAASSATSGYTSKATIGRSTSDQYINIPPGYNSAGAYYVISAVTNGSASAPSTISGTSATVSTGTNTLTLTKTVSVTPTVSAGYVSSGTATNSSVSLTASVTTKAAATITPGTTNQTIASGTYLTGTQTIVGDSDLVGSNILSTANIFGVQGTVVVQNYYTGSSAPSSSLGSNGDLYLQS